MNVYDFDKTIYNRDSTADFYFYCLKKHPKILLSLPSLAFSFLLYILGIYTKTRFKENMYRFLRHLDDVDSDVKSFWEINKHNIKKYYILNRHSTDVVISASPEFLLEPISKILGFGKLIASRVDKKTGLYTGENCWGEEKVKRFKAECPNAHCEEFYSDSLSDTPMALIADKAYIVDGQQLIEWDKYKPSGLGKFKEMFLSREFLMFLIIGGINTINGVLFASLYSLIIKNANIAFIVGYISSMVISYILNSKLTFKERLSLIKYVKFFISYMPNFIIQNIMVIIFYNMLGWNKILVYAIAAVIGVPVTFIFMKIFAFGKRHKK